MPVWYMYLTGYACDVYIYIFNCMRMWYVFNNDEWMPFWYLFMMDEYLSGNCICWMCPCGICTLMECIIMWYGWLWFACLRDICIYDGLYAYVLRVYMNVCVLILDACKCSVNILIVLLDSC